MALKSVAGFTLHHRFFPARREMRREPITEPRGRAGFDQPK